MKMKTSKEHNTICLWYFMFEMLAGARLLGISEQSSLAPQLPVVLHLLCTPTLYSTYSMYNKQNKTNKQEKISEMH